jgi:hypothetical protein
VTEALEEQIKGLTEQVSARARNIGKIEMQKAVYEWALEHRDRLEIVGLKDSLISCCEKAIKE